MRVGVVGAGVTGLAITHYLAERGVDVVTFEADAEPGGVVRSERVDGALLESGPQRVRLTPELSDLVDELELRGELLVADGDLPLYVYADGDLREVPRSVQAFLRTDLLSWRGKLRLLAEPLTDPARPDESAGDLFRRKFGEEAYRNVVEPLFGGIYGSDPAEMPVEYSLSRLVALEDRTGSLLRAAVERLLGDAETPPPASFEDGLQTLPRALYEANRPYVHLNAPVESVRRSDETAGGTAGADGSTAAGGTSGADDVTTVEDTSAADGRGEDPAGFVLEADGRSVAVDRVVVTVPGPAAATLLADLEGATAAPLGDLTYNSLALVHLRSDLEVRGFGYQVRRDEPLETLGVTWNAGLFDRDGVFTAFFGGVHDPDVVDRPDAELGEVAREEFRQVTGADAAVVSVTKLPRALPAHDASWAALEDVDLPAGVELATNYTSRIGVPSRIREAKRVAGRLAEDARADES